MRAILTWFLTTVTTCPFQSNIKEREKFYVWNVLRSLVRFFQEMFNSEYIFVKKAIEINDTNDEKFSFFFDQNKRHDFDRNRQQVNSNSFVFRK